MVLKGLCHQHRLKQEHLQIQMPSPDAISSKSFTKRLKRGSGQPLLDWTLHLIGVGSTFMVNLT